MVASTEDGATRYLQLGVVARHPSRMPSPAGAGRCQPRLGIAILHPTPEQRGMELRHSEACAATSIDEGHPPGSVE